MPMVCNPLDLPYRFSELTVGPFYRRTFREAADPLNSDWEEIPGRFPFFDPSLFQDDHGRVYLYWGTSATKPIQGQELDRTTFERIGEDYDPKRRNLGAVTKAVVPSKPFDPAQKRPAASWATATSISPSHRKRSCSKAPSTGPLGTPFTTRALPARAVATCFNENGITRGTPVLVPAERRSHELAGAAEWQHVDGE